MRDSCIMITSDQHALNGGTDKILRYAPARYLSKDAESEESSLRRKKEVRRSSCKALLARAITKAHAHAGAYAVAVNDAAERGLPEPTYLTQLTALPSAPRFSSTLTQASLDQHAFPSCRYTCPSIAPSRAFGAQHLRSCPLHPSSFVLSWRTVELSRTSIWSSNLHGRGTRGWQ